MIYFKTIRYKNFLSSGNLFTEIFLDKTKTTLIVGENGAGKSTMIDALCFCLYNRAFRNINKPNLCNSITQKNCTVEVEFSINNKEYLIRRGIKPEIFEIYKDGKLLDQSSKTGDYQKLLEKQILKMNFKSFTQIVILGSSNYIPFMRLPPHIRREVIEDLLDIQIFSVMNTLLREKINKNKQAITDNEYNIRICREKIELNQKYIMSLKQNNESLIEDKNSRISLFRTDIDSYQVSLAECQANLLQYQSEYKKKEKGRKALQQIEELRLKLLDKIQKINDDIHFYEKNNECPTCKQDIDLAFRDNIIKIKNESKIEFEKGIDGLNAKYKEFLVILDILSDLNQKINNINNQIISNNQEIKSRQDQIAALQEEIQSLNIKNNEIRDDNEEKLKLDQELESLNSTKEELAKDRDVLGLSAVLLKDGGIKTQVVKQYIPVMNKLINEYLDLMDFFVNFELDENFQEKIKSRHRDVFSYESFSEGEKVRINLAILFCWRAISKMRNSSQCSLLILDEVLDGSLDNTGIDEFMKLLMTQASDINVFIISHKFNMLDKFDSVLEFKKVRNFSRIV